MVTLRTSAFVILVSTLFALTGVILLTNFLAGNSAVHVERATDRSYEKLPRIVDSEQRLKRLDENTSINAYDTTALVGMPDEYGEALSKYTRAIVEAVSASPLTRPRYYHKDRRGNACDVFPDDANPVYDKDVVIPLVIFPRPDAVRRWSASTAARALGWREENNVIEDRRSVYGRTVIFEPGRLSENPWEAPASPHESQIPFAYSYFVTDFFLVLGKIVVAQDYVYNSELVGVLQDKSVDLHLGEKGGAKMLGEFVTVPAYLQNTRLRWVSIREGSDVRRFLAYVLLDGNGARRWRYPAGMSINNPISPYVRPLVCDRYQPQIKQHDELLLPTPLGWPPTGKEWADSSVDSEPHEERCLDEWFPAQREACWVIREAEDSKPLQESFLLMPAAEKSDRPVFFIALFAETEPKQLIAELAALYNVSPDTALNSPETMERLNNLYQQIRDFPLSK